MTIPNTVHGYNVIAHAEIDDLNAVVLVQQSTGYVTAVINDSTLEYNEWALGHYFQKIDDAKQDFIERAGLVPAQNGART